MPLILFVLSWLVLTLEVLETKIFAYSLENSLIFLVVGVVLLGFGAGGSVLSLRKELGDVRRLLRRNLLVTAVMLVVAHAFFAQFSDHLQFEVWDAAAGLPDFWTIAILLLLASPYFSAGMAISAILAEPKGDVHARYGINLCGSALGCVTVFFVLGPLTAPQCLVVCAAVAAALAVPLGPRKGVLSAVIAVLGVPLFLFADDVLPYRIQKAETAGQLALIEKNARQVAEDENNAVQQVRVVEEFDRWDPTARVQVHSLAVETTDENVRAQLERLPSMWFTQDSSYGSPLIGRGRAGASGVGAVYERTCYGIGYFREQPAADVLVIGLGGAPDVQTALHHGVRSVIGVDINATTVAMVRFALREFLGDPYADPRVAIHLKDGRSFVRGSSAVYDLIQLSGVDTKSVLAAGTLALNESYLYTREAFDEYLARLAPDGMLCIVYAGEVFRQRLAITAMASLSAGGVGVPERHLMMVAQNAIFCLLVKKSAFTAEECTQMDAWLRRADEADGRPDRQTGVFVMVYELLNPGLSLNPAPTAIWLPDGRPTEDSLMRAVLAGELDAFIADSPWDVAPAPDSRPFFFNIHRTAEVFRAPPEHFQRMFRLLWIMLALAVVLILGPLCVLGRRGLHAWRNLPFALYFAALGAGYIMAMSGLIQRYVLFLGHQSYAFAVVIGGLLSAAGLGAVLSGRFAATPRKVMVVAVAAICVSLALLQLGLDPLFSLTAGLGQTSRILLSLLCLLPLGVPLGMMFPTGLGLVKRASPLFVPWAFGINGVCSVIGTALVMPGAILFGFPAMALAAGVTYVAALGVGLLATRSGAAP